MGRSPGGGWTVASREQLVQAPGGFSQDGGEGGRGERGCSGRVTKQMKRQPSTGSGNLSCEDRRVNMSDLQVTFSVAATQLCCCHTNAARDKEHRNECVWPGPNKTLFTNRQRAAGGLRARPARPWSRAPTPSVCGAPAQAPARVGHTTERGGGAGGWSEAAPTRGGQPLPRRT